MLKGESGGAHEEVDRLLRHRELARARRGGHRRKSGTRIPRSGRRRPAADALRDRQRVQFGQVRPREWKQKFRRHSADRLRREHRPLRSELRHGPRHRGGRSRQGKNRREGEGDLAGVHQTYGRRR